MSSAAYSCELPPEITNSKLYAAGGALILPDLLAADALAELEAEALSVEAGGQRSEVAVSDGTEGRGGNPARALRTAPAGEVQWRLFSAPAMVASLAQICGLTVVPTGGGTYSFYDLPGDFLGLHRDVDTCDVTVITCLIETGRETGGGLWVYPRHLNLPLTSARAAGRASATPVPTDPGVSAVLLGGVAPHELTAMQPGQRRVVSVMCYRIILAGNPLL